MKSSIGGKKYETPETTLVATLVNDITNALIQDQIDPQYNPAVVSR